jgi:XTP/dITP diphosphohydrolase
VKLVLATANAGKQREFAALLAPLGIELLLQSALGIQSVAETGTTFEANALLKARHAAAQAGQLALADDSGLEVDALDGRPGVWSARFAGAAASDAEMPTIMRSCWRSSPPCRRSAAARVIDAYWRWCAARMTPAR